MRGRRPRSDDGEWEPPALYGYGTGSLHGLRDEDDERPRLLGMRSVSRAAAWVLHKPKPKAVKHPVGFRR